jgi:predicted ATP-dependent endonuclease of OLD family
MDDGTAKSIFSDSDFGNKTLNDLVKHEDEKPNFIDHIDAVVEEVENEEQILKNIVTEIFNNREFLNNLSAKAAEYLYHQIENDISKLDINTEILSEFNVRADDFITNKIVKLLVEELENFSKDI